MTYTVKYLKHYNPNQNGNKGKHWRKLNGKFVSVETALDAFNTLKAWQCEAYPEDKFLTVRVMNNKEIIKEIEL